jgi:glycosyltransferase involved in cell wall biosynthesis
MIRWADVVHLTAVYSSPVVPALLICKLLNKPVVWSPRGSLQRWEGSTRRRSKRIWEIVCNLLCDPDRVLLHVTSEEERKDSSARIKRTKAEVIPNGVDVSPINYSREWQPDGNLRLLYLGRLHPIKGIENLLQAAACVGRNITLTIHGDGEPAYKRSLESLASELSLRDRVHFYGKVNGEGKAQSFREADVCVVPSHKENFCMVIAEALAQGVPVIASRGTPWKDIEDIGCGKWVDNSPETLAEAIRQISQMPLREMGQRGREWMRKEFEWAVVAERMAGIYRSLTLHQAPK